LACALGFGSKLVPSLVEAQEKLANATRAHAWPLPSAR
jgi:hypothetical protein